MATIYDFPTNYEEKLREVDELLEKKYIDQAICVLEDWLHCVGGMNSEGEREVRKKLLSCYLLKREYESCEEMISQLKKIKAIDLTIAAHDIVVSLLQNKKHEGDLKQTEYQQLLKLSAFAQKNLVELVFQLKTFYEDEWLNEMERKFLALIKAEKFEDSLLALSDLQEVETEYFITYQDYLKQFFETQQPLLKTMLFELVSQKGLNLEVEFVDGEETRKISTTIANLECLYKAIYLTQKEILSLEVDEMTTMLLEQQIMMFYQFVFPFFEKIDKKMVLHELGKSFCAIILEEFENDVVDMCNDSIKKAYTMGKINQYMLSLSLLM